MEYWVSKADDGLILFSEPCHPDKNRSHSAKPSIPPFQYSIIPRHMYTAEPISFDLAQLPARREDQVFNVRIKLIGFRCQVSSGR
jgi:hypothetical protein